MRTNSGRFNETPVNFSQLFLLATNFAPLSLLSPGTPSSLHFFPQHQLQPLHSPSELVRVEPSDDTLRDISSQSSSILPPVSVPRSCSQCCVVPSRSEMRVVVSEYAGSGSDSGLRSFRISQGDVDGNVVYDLLPVWESKLPGPVGRGLACYYRSNGDTVGVVNCDDDHLVVFNPMTGGPSDVAVYGRSPLSCISLKDSSFSFRTGITSILPCNQILSDYVIVTFQGHPKFPLRLLNLREPARHESFGLHTLQNVSLYDSVVGCHGRVFAVGDRPGVFGCDSSSDRVLRLMNRDRVNASWSDRINSPLSLGMCLCSDDEDGSGGNRLMVGMDNGIVRVFDLRMSLFSDSILLVSDGDDSHGVLAMAWSGQYLTCGLASSRAAVVCEDRGGGRWISHLCELGSLSPTQTLPFVEIPFSDGVDARVITDVCCVRKFQKIPSPVSEPNDTPSSHEPALAPRPLRNVSALPYDEMKLYAVGPQTPMGALRLPNGLPFYKQSFVESFCSTLEVTLDISAVADLVFPDDSTKTVAGFVVSVRKGFGESLNTFCHISFPDAWGFAWLDFVLVSSEAVWQSIFVNPRFYRQTARLSPLGCAAVLDAELTDPSLGPPLIYASKLCSPPLSSFLGQLIEVHLMCRLSCPELVDYIGCLWFPRSSNIPFIPFLIVMEKCEGTILEYLRNHRPVTKELIVDILLQICDGMIVLHSRGIIHRDLKPSNLLYVEEDGRLIVKIGDFGLLRSFSAVPVSAEASPSGGYGVDLRVTHSVNPTSNRVGTAEYMPPDGQSIVDTSQASRIDIYSFGITAWSLITLEKPYPNIPSNRHHRDALCAIHHGLSGSLRPALSSIPDEFEALIPLLVACWEEDSVNRPRSFDEIREYLELFRDGDVSGLSDKASRLSDRRLVGVARIRFSGVRLNSNNILFDLHVMDFVSPIVSADLVRTDGDSSPPLALSLESFVVESRLISYPIRLSRDSLPAGAYSALVVDSAGKRHRFESVLCIPPTREWDLSSSTIRIVRGGTVYVEDSMLSILSSSQPLSMYLGSTITIHSSGAQTVDLLVGDVSLDLTSEEVEVEGEGESHYSSSCFILARVPPSPAPLRIVADSLCVCEFQISVETHPPASVQLSAWVGRTNRRVYSATPHFDSIRVTATVLDSTLLPCTSMDWIGVEWGDGEVETLLQRSEKAPVFGSLNGEYEISLDVSRVTEYPSLFVVVVVSGETEVRSRPFSVVQFEPIDPVHTTIIKKVPSVLYLEKAEFLVESRLRGGLTPHRISLVEFEFSPLSDPTVMLREVAWKKGGDDKGFGGMLEFSYRFLWRESGKITCYVDGVQLRLRNSSSPFAFEYHGLDEHGCLNLVAYATLLPLPSRNHMIDLLPRIVETFERSMEEFAPTLVSCDLVDCRYYELNWALHEVAESGSVDAILRSIKKVTRRKWTAFGLSFGPQNTYQMHCSRVPPQLVRLHLLPVPGSVDEFDDSELTATKAEFVDLFRQKRVRVSEERIEMLEGVVTVDLDSVDRTNRIATSTKQPKTAR